MKTNQTVIKTVLGITLLFGGIGGGYLYDQNIKLKEQNDKLEERQKETLNNNSKLKIELKEKSDILNERETKIQNLEQKLQEEKKKLDEKDAELKKALAAKEAKRQREVALSKQTQTKKSEAVVVSRNNSEVVSKEFYVEATAYTPWCAGCSGITATGINVAANPNMKVIAVDPRVIPLGSKVWVEGYGYAIAGDTGGAIKGNKIDLLMSSKDKAYKWGRKKVRIKVLG